MRRLVPVLALALLAATPRSAHADGKSAAAAQALFEEARALLAKGDYAAACQKLEGSQALDPGPGTQFNLAICYEKSGRTASAWAMYLEAAAAYQATNRPEWETKARDKAALLAGSLGKLTIVLPADAPADLVVTRDGVGVVRSEIGVAIPTDPGAHVVETSAPGRAPSRTSVDVTRGTTTVVTVSVSEPVPGAFDHHPMPVDPPPEAPRPRRSLAFVLGGVGLAGVALGAVSGLVALDKNASSTDRCPNDGVCTDAAARSDNRAASAWATVSTISFVAGGALLGTGVVLYVLAPSGKTTATVTPFVGLGRAGLTGRW